MGRATASNGLQLSRVIQMWTRLIITACVFKSYVAPHYIPWLRHQFLNDDRQWSRIWQKNWTKGHEIIYLNWICSVMISLGRYAHWRFRKQVYCLWGSIISKNLKWTWMPQWQRGRFKNRRVFLRLLIKVFLLLFSVGSSHLFTPYIGMATTCPVLGMVPWHRFVLRESLWNDTKVIINGLRWHF